MHVLSSSLRSALVRALALSALLIVAGPLRSRAADIFFTNKNSSVSLTTAGNWDPNSVPGAGDTAWLTNRLSQTYTLGSDLAAANVYAGSTGSPLQTLTLDLGSGRSWTVTNQFFLLTQSNSLAFNSGTLAVTNGDRTAQMVIGDGSRNIGLTVRGGTLLADSITSLSATDGKVRFNNGILELFGSGTSSIAGDFQAQATDHAKTMTVRGTNTTISVGQTLGFYTGGNQATNTFILTDGATMSGNGATLAGRNKLLITENAQLFAGGHLYLTSGRDSDQTLVVSNGGQLVVNNLGTGGSGPSDVSFSLFTGSNTLVIATNVYVGTNGFAYSRGKSAILIENGAVLEARTITTGYGSSGAITNQGGTLRFTISDPTLTDHTPGSVVVKGGTIEFLGVSNANLEGAIGQFTYADTNTLTLNSATNARTSAYAIGTGQAFATLDLRGNASYFRSTNFSIGTGGTLLGSGTIESFVVTNAGTIRPGHSPGMLEFSSNLTLTSGSLLVLEIAGTNAGAYDRLLVDGVLSAGGTLAVTNLGWTFAAGDAFDLLDFAAFSGNFDTMSLPTLSGGLLWDTSLFGTQGVLSVIPVPEPTALMAMGAGLAFLLFLRRRREG
ncbi:MAG: PEP-CTERM sorting domain-containing protein [Verrucomicrobiae bacterium]|nr:PEP-CTERM sorting domain-containing protein [Verrucomicrobiae bacterium]